MDSRDYGKQEFGYKESLGSTPKRRIGWRSWLAIGGIVAFSLEAVTSAYFLDGPGSAPAVAQATSAEKHNTVGFAGCTAVLNSEKPFKLKPTDYNSATGYVNTLQLVSDVYPVIPGDGNCATGQLIAIMNKFNPQFVVPGSPDLNINATVSGSTDHLIEIPTAIGS